MLWSKLVEHPTGTYALIGVGRVAVCLCLGGCPQVNVYVGWLTLAFGGSWEWPNYRSGRVGGGLVAVGWR